MVKRLGYVFLIILMITSIIGGCQKDTPKKPVNPSPPAPSSTGLSESEQRIMASKISNICEKIDGVNRASVVITAANLTDLKIINQKKDIKLKKSDKKDVEKNQPIARPVGRVAVLIGIGVSEELQDNNEAWNKTKEQIINQIKGADVTIAQVYVTKEPETVGRIDNIASAMLQGEAATQYQDEITDIINKLKK